MSSTGMKPITGVISAGSKISLPPVRLSAFEMTSCGSYDLPATFNFRALKTPGWKWKLEWPKLEVEGKWKLEGGPTKGKVKDLLLPRRVVTATIKPAILPAGLLRSKTSYWQGQLRSMAAGNCYQSAP